jgi:hypothetical protein
MSKYSNYLKDEQTGLYLYANKPSAISFDDYNRIQYSAHEGSRYLGPEARIPEYFYRLHAGQDIGSLDGGVNIKGVPIRSIVTGTFLEGDEFTVETGNGYALKYRHMPPESYKLLKTGDEIFVNSIVGEVGKYNTGPYHLHIELLKGESILDKDNKVVGYKYNEVLDPSKVRIEGGRIIEQNTK